MAQTTELKRLMIRLVGNMDGYKKMLKEAGSMTGAKLTAMGKKVSSVGKSMTAKLTLPLAAVGAASVMAFGNFDKAMTESTSIMKVTESQMEAMRSKALAMAQSGEFRQGPEELAKSYFFLASAGKDAEQSMALLPMVSKFATAGAFDMALATDLLTDAQSALGLTSKDIVKDQQNMARVADVLVKANTLANASVQQFSESLTNTAGASLRAYNKSVEEGVAVLAAYADQGVKGNVAGTNLSRVMLLLSKSASKNAKEHKKLGFEVFDSSGKMRNFADIVENIEKVTAGMSDELRSATLTQLGFEARVQQAILPLLGTSSAIRKYQKDLENAGGTVESVSGKQMEAFSNKLAVIKNRLTVVSIEIGKALVPFIERMTEALSEGVKWWNSLDTSTKENIVSFGVVVAAIGPLLIILGTLISSIGTLITTLGAAKAGMMAFAAMTGTAKVGLIAFNASLLVVGAGILYVIKLTFDLIKALADLNTALKEGEVLNNQLNQKKMADVDKLIKKTEQLGNSEKRKRKSILGNAVKDAQKEIDSLEIRLKQVKRQEEEFSAGGYLSPFQHKMAIQEIKEVEARLKSANSRSDKLKQAIKDVAKPIKETAEETGKAVENIPKPDIKLQKEIEDTLAKTEMPKLPQEVRDKVGQDQSEEYQRMVEKLQASEKQNSSGMMIDPHSDQNAANLNRMAAALDKMAGIKPKETLLQGAVR